MSVLYQRTMTKKKELVAKGYNYVCIWEHDFDKMLTQSDAMKDFVSAVDLSEPLCPKDSFKGKFYSHF